MSSRRALALLKVAGGLALLGWLLALVEPRDLAAALARGDATATASGITLLLLAVPFQVVRLVAVARSFGLGMRESWRITLASYTFNQLLPGALGGEGYRALHLRRLTERWGAAIGLVTADRFFGALALLVPGTLYLAIEHRRVGALLATMGPEPGLPIPGTATWIGVALVAVAALAGALLWSRGARARVLLSSGLASLTRSVLTIGWRRTALALSLSMAYHGVRLVAFERLLAALGERVAATDLLFVLAATLAISLLPLTIGALGLKEGALVVGLGLFGVGQAEALAVAMLNRIVLVALALAGSVVLLLAARTAPAAVETPPAGRSRSASPGGS